MSGKELKEGGKEEKEGGIGIEDTGRSQGSGQNGPGRVLKSTDIHYITGANRGHDMTIIFSVAPASTVHHVGQVLLATL
jgi:hypothetical protein